MTDIKPGDSCSSTVVFDREAAELFARLSGDDSGIHRDRSAAARQGYDDLVLHGLLVATPFSRMLGTELPGDRAVIGSVELSFHQATYLGEALTYRVEVARVLPALRSVLLDLTAEKADGTHCLRGRAHCVFR